MDFEPLNSTNFNNNNPMDYYSNQPSYNSFDYDARFNDDNDGIFFEGENVKFFFIF